MLSPASSGFPLLPSAAAIPITGPTSSIASSLASTWLASGHPKLNRGRMFLETSGRYFDNR